MNLLRVALRVSRAEMVPTPPSNVLRVWSTVPPPEEKEDAVPEQREPESETLPTE